MKVPWKHEGALVIYIKNFATYVTDFAVQDLESVALVGSDGATLSYSEFADASGSLAKLLGEYHATRLGLFADRTIGAYIGVLASAWNGIAYVPFSLKAPSDRLREQLKLTDCRAILIDENGIKSLTDEIKEQLPKLVIATDFSVQTKLSEIGVQSVVVETSSSYPEPQELVGTEEAYIIFTSGSSGAPKGVLISTAARAAYVETFTKRHHFSQDDRVAQPVDLSWDLSVGNIVVAFSNNAPLYLMGARAILSPARFILMNRITVWHSVPTVADMLLERGTLKENIFPDLRWTSFIGAPLHPKTAQAWQASAPNSKLINSYGPTEMTVECLDYTLPKPFLGDVVPIGIHYPQTEALILNKDGAEASVGEFGELLLSGTQQADGYLDDPAKTNDAFIWREDQNGQKRRWYRTGDLVFQDTNGLFYFKGRLDHQVKVLGYRVELEEIEIQLRRVTGLEKVLVSGYPFNQSAVDELVAFVVLPEGGRSYTSAKLRACLENILPPYMIPHRFFALESLPQTSNGKINRKALCNYMSADNEI